MKPSKPSTETKSLTPKWDTKSPSEKWDTVTKPGAYICNDTGRLLRVPTCALISKRHPAVEFLGPKGSAFVTRLSEDPILAIPELRKIAQARKIEAQF